MVGEAGDEGGGAVVWPSDCARGGSVESGPSIYISGEVGDAPVTAPLEQGAAVDRRQQRGANDYVKRARELVH